MFSWKWISGEIKKVSLYKFTYILLLKNDIQWKQKSNKQFNKKIDHLNLLLKKIMYRKKKSLSLEIKKINK